MPSDAATRDGAYRFGRSLKSEKLIEQQRFDARTPSTFPAYSLGVQPYIATAAMAESQNGSADGYGRVPRSEPEAANGYGFMAHDRVTTPEMDADELFSAPISRPLGRGEAAFPTGVVVPPLAQPDTGPALMPHLANSSDAAADSVQAQLQRFLSDQVTPIRLASHLAVLAVAAVVLLVSQMEMPNWQFSLRSLPEDGLFAAQSAESTAFTRDNPLGTNSVAEATEAFHRAVVPFTSNQPEGAASAALAQPSAEQPGVVQSQEPAAPPVDEIRTYVVRPGDTVLGIAAKFNMKPDTILWANPELESNPDLLRVGDRLVILPVDGVLHVVKPGDTLSAIAAKYKVTPQSIADYPLNRLENINTPLSVGTQLVVPEGTKPYIARQVVAYNGTVPESARRGTGSFAWPTSGTITQPFWNGHRAIDIGAWTGTPIVAADSGYVIVVRTSGWNSGYGRMVMVDHGNGYMTLYAHMNTIFVRQGESVAKGEQIGTVGNTGNSTGPHLHFEVRYQRIPRNPFNYLP